MWEGKAAKTLGLGMLNWACWVGQAGVEDLRSTSVLWQPAEQSRAGAAGRAGSRGLLGKRQ